MNLKKISLFLLAFIPNSYIAKSMFYYFPNLTYVSFGVLFLLLGLYLFENYSQKHIYVNTLDISIFIWLIVYLCTVFYSPYFDAGINKWLTLFVSGISLIYFCRIYINSKYDFDFFINCYVIISFLIEILVIQNFISLGMPLGRFSFYGAHPIPLGMMGSVTAITVVCQFIANKISFLKFFPVIISSAWIVMISSSKGPFLSLLLGLCLLLPSIFKKLKTGILFLTIGSIVYLIISNTSQYQEMILRLSYASEDQSSYTRLGLFSTAIEYFHNHPLIGNGIGIFNDIYPHNIFLEIFAEGGIMLGVPLFIFVLYIIFNYFEYVFKFRKEYYYYLPLILTMMSISVLLVSYSFVLLKFLYIGIGLFLVRKLVMKSEDVPITVTLVKKKRLFKRYRIVWTRL